MNPVDNYPQGYWQVGDLKFINKYQAMLHASQAGGSLQYMFFDSVWRNFDRSLLNKFSLQELYKQRAQQLRDSYDYLVLYFSGGADSYNVLRSFVDNGIHLDEVCVKWCKDTIDSGIYTPNTLTDSAVNYLSEWDYAIKPVLAWLGQHHPNIKIEVVDWFKDRLLIGKEEIFNVVNHWHDVEVTSLAVWSPNELKMIDQGKTVGSIYGIDKPNTYLENGNWYMFFADAGAGMGTPAPYNVGGTEYFYWTPNFPILAYEMANSIIKEVKINPKLRDITFVPEVKTNLVKSTLFWQEQQKLHRHILYDNWTNLFQAYKPMTLDRSDKHWWLYKYDELSKFKDGYQDMINLHTQQLDSRFYNTDSKSTMYKHNKTFTYFVVTD